MSLERLNPSSLSPPSGFSHATRHGPLLFLAGQTAQDASGAIVGDGVVAQFERALDNLLTVLAAAGGRPDQLAKMTVYCTVPDEYLANLRALGEIWRRRVGRDYPAMTFVGVQRLFDPQALVELDAIAVVR